VFLALQLEKLNLQILIQNEKYDFISKKLEVLLAKQEFLSITTEEPIIQNYFNQMVPFILPIFFCIATFGLFYVIFLSPQDKIGRFIDPEFYQMAKMHGFNQSDYSFKIIDKNSSIVGDFSFSYDLMHGLINPKFIPLSEEILALNLHPYYLVLSNHLTEPTLGPSAVLPLVSFFGLS